MTPLNLFNSTFIHNLDVHNRDRLQIEISTHDDIIIFVRTDRLYENNVLTKNASE